MARNREVDLEVRNIYNAVSEGKTTITSDIIENHKISFHNNLIFNEAIEWRPLPIKHINTGRREFDCFENYLMSEEGILAKVNKLNIKPINGIRSSGGSYICVNHKTAEFRLDFLYREVFPENEVPMWMTNVKLTKVDE